MGGTAGSLDILERTDLRRRRTTRRLDAATRSERGQFLSPPPLARFMASLFERIDGDVRLLEPGAGVGSLVAGFVAELATRRPAPRSLTVTAYEVEPVLATALTETLSECERACKTRRIRCQSEVEARDFIEGGVARSMRSSGKRLAGFTHAIANPPYAKLASSSEARRQLRLAGIETTNLYAAFVALAVRLLAPGGELVAITPRSFCNGPYFRSFRELLLREVAFRRIHVFDSRRATFSEDEVLQENVVLHVVKGGVQGDVIVSSSSGPGAEDGILRRVRFEELVRPGDARSFFHLPVDEDGVALAAVVDALPTTLEGLGLSVSTGKVVDFRARRFLRAQPDRDTQPLVYPTHFERGVVCWPKSGRKPNALVDAPETSALWMPSGTYVLVRRMSAKEEARRVVAALFDPKRIVSAKVGFENHLNVFHRRGGGLTPDVARGLVAFLSSRCVDAYVRRFSGHTQVNATDLRSLRYPTLATLRSVGRRLIAEDAAVDLDAAGTWHA